MFARETHARDTQQRPSGGFETDREPWSYEVGGLQVRLARNEAEVAAAQALRYRVFHEEMRGITSDASQHAIDIDRFDAVADHLIVTDTARVGAIPPVIGTYRLIRREASRRCGGFYSATEFDVSKLRNWPGEVLELGRSCVDGAYRTRMVIDLLWRGISHYLQQHNIQVLFGCGSLPGADPDALRLPLSYLHHFHLAPRHLRPRARQECTARFELLAKDAIHPRRAFASLPPLIKGYLRLGGMVGEGAVVDPEFNCVDVCVIVMADRIPNRYARHYSCEMNNLDAA